MISDQNSERNQKVNSVDEGIQRLTIDHEGKIHGNNNRVLLARTTKIFITLGWICAALTIFYSIYFSVAGITFGFLANRESKGAGNVIIIANIVMVGISLFFGFLFVASRRYLLGY